MPEIYSNQLSRVLPFGEKILLEWKHNLSLGASPEVITNPVIIKRLTNLAILAGKAVGCRFASIDILESTSGDWMVLEMNAGVAMDQFIEKNENGYDIAYKIYHAAIMKTFNSPITG